MDCVGALTACSFEESDTFLTHRFTQSYLETNNLPDLTSYLLIDTISATKKPAGLLLLLRAYITAQSKYDGICFIGATRAGKKLGANFGMQSHSYKEDGVSRELLYMKMGELSLSHLNQKLLVGSPAANLKVLTEVCTRNGVMNKGKIYSRC